MFKLSVDNTKKFFRLSEVSEMTSLAIHPIIDGELDADSAVAANAGQLHFSKDIETKENVVLKRLTDTQIHKLYLERLIREGAIKVMHHQSMIPLDATPEDMPSSDDLFDLYIISQSEFVNFARLLSIDVLIEVENAQEADSSESIQQRNQVFQQLAEEYARINAEAGKPKLTKCRAARKIADLPKYKSHTPETIERNIKKTW